MGQFWDVRSARVYTTAAALATYQGPDKAPRYAVVRSLGNALFYWVPGDTTTADNITAISHSGGTPGRWLLTREDDAGVDLTDAAATIYVSGGKWRTLPLSTLSANRILTLGTTGAVAGDRITITRLDSEAFTYTVANGGTGGGNLAVMLASCEDQVTAQFDGVDWVTRVPAVASASLLNTMDHGQVFQAGNASALTPGDSTNFFPVPFSAPALGAAAHQFALDTTGGICGLKYTGATARVLHVTCAFSMVTGGDGKIIELDFALNGTPSGQAVLQRKQVLGGDVCAGAFHWIVEVVQNDVISIEARNTTDTSTVTITHINLQAVGMVP